MPPESGPTQTPRRAPILWLAIAGLFLLVVLSASFQTEGVGVSPSQVVLVIANHTPLIGKSIAPPPKTFNDIVWQIRLPRVVVAILIGALLGYAGAALQGLLMNPLADPYTVGVSAGAAVGAAATEVFGLSALWMGFGGVAAAFAAS